MSRTQEERRQWWRQLVAQQEQSGVSVRAFYERHRTSEHSFYQWRKRLAARLPVKFALVETNGSAPPLCFVGPIKKGLRPTIRPVRCVIIVRNSRLRFLRTRGINVTTANNSP